MSEMRTLLVDSASRLFSDLCTRPLFDVAEKGGLDLSAWRALEQAGLPRATVPESLGGTGADLGDALELVREAGRLALPLPLADTLLAQHVLSAAALASQDGVGTIGPVVQARRNGEAASSTLTLTRTAGQWLLSGTLHRVPWARHADFLAAVARSGAGHATVRVPQAALRAAIVRHDVNWANEPRDTLAFREVALEPEWVGAPDAGFSCEDLRFQGALFRLCAMSGAMGQVLRLAVQYAKDRTQFGKPIGHFQAVQHSLAVLASQVAAANACADATVDAVSRAPAHFEIAAAKARIGEAAHIACGIAHQVHGAMGFTQEHVLHRSTRRLWAWRDEFGTEAEWAEWIGRVAVRLGGSGLWPFLTSPDKALPGRVPARQP